jgi:hypothetical protein
MNRPTVLTPGDQAIRALARSRSPLTAKRARAEARSRRGKALVIAGWLSATTGVILYCVASFTAADTDLAAIVLHGAVPAARAALVIVLCGVILWVVGSVMHMNAQLDAAELEGTGRD